MPSQEYTYYAFISYSHTDIKWGKRLERKLAGFKMPATLCSERGWKRKPINPIFFAPYDIQPGDLDEELKARLRASKNLIVICSPDSAQSEWVGKEIRYFHELGRDKHIFFFIVKGEPHSQDPTKECFNPIVNELDIPEILGANIHEKVYRLPYLNKQRAYIQLVSKLLEVEFDSIWQRHKRLLIWQWVSYTFFAILIGIVFAFMLHLYKPIDVDIAIKEDIYNPHLPQLENADVTLYYGDDFVTKETNADLHVVFNQIPRSVLQKPQRLKIKALNFIPLDTVIFLQSNMQLSLRRDSLIYGDIDITILQNDLTPAANMEFNIDNRYSVISDDHGRIRLYIPLREQKEFYTIHSKEATNADTIFMPCRSGRYIIMQ